MSLSTHPALLSIRFGLEIAALVAMGRYGLSLGGAGPLRFVLMIAIPALAATAWGVFAVPGDPSRSGNAPVPIPGALRLALELAFFGFGVWALIRTDARSFGIALAAATLLLYALSFDRIRWLLER